MIVYAEEQFSECVEECKIHAETHWHEVACDQIEVPLEMDYERYYHLESIGSLKCITARNNGILVGYCWMIVSTHLHNKNTLFAFEDIYFLAPECRNGRVGLRLFQYVESVMKSLGVVKIVMTTKTLVDHSRLFKYLGYINTELCFSKLIK